MFVLIFRLSMPSHNSKYYAQSLKTKPINSQKNTTLFKRKSESDDKAGPSSRKSKSDDVPSCSADCGTSQPVTLHDNSTSRVTEIVTESVTVSEENSINIVDESNLASSEKTVAAKDKINDLQTAINSLEYYQKRFPDFYYCIVSKGWYCKTCSNFTQNKVGITPFVNTVGTFGDHPTRRANKQLDSERHSQSLKNKLIHKCERCTNIWKLLQEASLSQEVQKWAHASNFKNVVELIADCGGDEVKTHLLNAPGNVMYLSPLWISKDINIMNSYTKESLLASLRSGKLALYNDETQDNIDRTNGNIYATFKNNDTIGEHFVGIIPISKLVESTLSAQNILSALENYLQSLDISLLNDRFFCMDTTNVNSGERD